MVGDTSTVVTGELASRAVVPAAVPLVAAIATIIITIALPTQQYAPAVGASKLSFVTAAVIFVASIAAVIVAIALMRPRYAPAVFTGKLALRAVAVPLVAAISTVLVAVTLPAVLDAATIVAPEEAAATTVCKTTAVATSIALNRLVNAVKC